MGQDSRDGASMVRRNPQGHCRGPYWINEYASIPSEPCANRLIPHIDCCELTRNPVLAGIVTLYGVSSMVNYNRKKRNAFYADQMRTQQELVVSAIEAEKEGRPMTEEQQLMLNREKARYQAEQVKRSQPGILKRIMAPVTGRLGGSEESIEGKAEEALVKLEKEVEGWGQAIEKKGKEVVQAVRHSERAIEKDLKETTAGNLMDGGKEAEAAVLGGLERSRKAAEAPSTPQAVSLDRMAEAATEVGKKKVEGWRGWFGG